MADGDRPTPQEVPHSPSAFRRLPDGASIEMLVQAYHEAMLSYANLATECRDHMRRRDTALETVSAEVVVLGAAVRSVTGKVTGLHGRVLDIEAKIFGGSKPKTWRSNVPPLPPMRPELDSHHALALEVGTAVAKRIDAEQKNPTTPPPTAETMAKIAGDAVQTALTRMKAEAWERIENERKAAEDARVVDRRKLRNVTIVAAITTAGTVIAALVEHFAR